MVEQVWQSGNSCITELCLLIGFSRQAYYQGIRYEEQKAFESELIIK